MIAGKFIEKESKSIIISAFNWFKGRFFRKTFKWSVSYGVLGGFDFENDRKEYHPVCSFLAYDVLKLRDRIVLSLINDIDDPSGRFILEIELGRSWSPCSWIWPWPWSWSRSWYVPIKLNWSWPWFWNWPWYHSRRLRGFGGKGNMTFLVYSAAKFERYDGLVDRRMESNIWLGFSKARFKEIIECFSSGESLTVVISNPNPKNSSDDDPIIIRFSLSNFKEVVQEKINQLESIAAKKKMTGPQSTDQGGRQ